jgi:hypothetical protein
MDRLAFPEREHAGIHGYACLAVPGCRRFIPKLSTNLNGKRINQMKPVSIIFAIITIVLIASQLLCGFWLAAKGPTAEGAAFHRNLGVSASTAAVITAVMTIILGMMK